ncbi:uncharacterized protein MELLADRAFT_104478 [Melampsora larici-populina 98AG31]|uniref:Uncharacterized protein n=1 Tax=Melampsora larici-populina (strain 98AG31 / pathotype 3-4-7) TaxID=747676 RepID=F4REU5_MELLP|nr:uncharacterized protein MELLADRAFT_104478 [Melampsora larici-populina 98AG31]EGG09222.1 hypothetical protein MELLADRAFT_104478 [Melampsora larici-populina 98AG31]
MAAQEFANQMDELIVRPREEIEGNDTIIDEREPIRGRTRSGMVRQSDRTTNNDIEEIKRQEVKKKTVSKKKSGKGKEVRIEDEEEVDIVLEQGDEDGPQREEDDHVEAHQEESTVGVLTGRVDSQHKDNLHEIKHSYIDNPFVIGGPMQNISPFDGSYNPNWDTPGVTIDNHAEMLTGRGVAVWGNQQNGNQGDTQASSSRGKVSKPYRGQHFNPYHSKSYQGNNQNWGNAYPYNQNQNNQFYQHNGNNQQYNRGRGRGGAMSVGRGRPAIGQGSFNKSMARPGQTSNSNGVGGSATNVTNNQ